MSESAEAGRPPTASMNFSTTSYVATCLTHLSAADFEETRRRMDDRVPLLEPAATVELVLGGASWSEVEAVVTRTAGPTGLVALARLDSGALLSLRGHALDATLYFVGNPIVASEIIAIEPAAALYAPFRVAIFKDANGVHVSYDQPSSVFKSLGSRAVDLIAVELDEKIRVAVEESCR